MKQARQSKALTGQAAMRVAAKKKVKGNVQYLSHTTHRHTHRKTDLYSCSSQLKICSDTFGAHP